MANPTAEQMINAVIVKKYRANARVIVSKTLMGWRQDVPLSPTTIVPDDDENNDVYINLVDLDIPVDERKPVYDEDTALTEFNIDGEVTAVARNPRDFIFCSTERCLGYQPQPCPICEKLIGCCECGALEVGCECESVTVQSGIIAVATVGDELKLDLSWAETGRMSTGGDGTANVQGETIT